MEIVVLSRPVPEWGHRIACGAGEVQRCRE